MVKEYKPIDNIRCTLQKVIQEAHGLNATMQLSILRTNIK